MSLDGTKDPQYFKSVRRMTAAFGTVFNNLWLIREDSLGQEATREKIALKYGPAQHWAMQIENRASMRADDNDTEISLKLPFMSYWISGFTQDASRQKNPLGYQKRTDATVQRKQFVPAPWNLSFELVAYSKNTEDGLKIIEQIIPYFTPHLNLKIVEVEDMSIVNDVALILDGLVQDDNYMSGLEENRFISWNFSFTMRGHVYPPYIDNPLIKTAIIDFDPMGLNTGDLSRVTVEANQFDPPDWDKDNSTVTVEVEVGDDPTLEWD